MKDEKVMRFIRFKAFILIFIFLALSACQDVEEMDRHLGDFSIFVSPILDPTIIQDRFSSLEEPFKEALILRGYTVNQFEIEVSSNYQAVGEALASGSIAVGFINNLTYAEFYDEAIEPILLAKRGGYSVNSFDPVAYNTGEVIRRDTVNIVDSYSGLIHTGPSNYGQTLYQLFTENGLVSWEELNEAKWCVAQNVTSATGYVLPSIWLKKTYNKSISELKNVVPLTSTSEFALYLATEECDIAAIYAGMRTDYEMLWQKDFLRTESIWNEVKVIGVTEPFLNDVFAISNNHPKMTAKLKQDLTEIIRSFTQTETGQLALGSLNILDLEFTTKDEFSTMVNDYREFKRGE